MATRQLKAVPLCLPDNWFFNGRTVSGDELRCRGSIKLCREGLNVLDEIGDDEIAVICITGPARSGKSYLLSKPVEGVSFEVGHGVVSKTTGIWIACSQDKKEMEEQKKARIVLLDAEGAGAVATEDDSVSREWDTKLYSLCCLLSSLMIYNSKKIPESVDLERLQFVANFSTAVSSADETGDSFKNYAPKLLWILRDVLDDPDPFKDWEDYFSKKVLVKRPERSTSDTSFNSVVHAINSLFQSFTVKALQPPSNSKIVCRDLDNPEYYQDIERFLEEIENVKRNIFSLTSVKKAGDTVMTGKRLLSLLNVYVEELNKDSGEISIKTCWDATISLHLETITQSSYEELEQEVSNIHLPLKEQEIEDKYSIIGDKIEELFLEKIVLKDEKIMSSFLEKLKKKIDRSLKSLQGRNIIASKRFCKTKAEEITNAHLEKIRQNISSPTIIEQLELYQNVSTTIFREYDEATEGLPKAKEIFETVKTEVSERIQSIQVWLILNKICENYKMHMNNVKLPVEETELTEKNKEAKSQAYDSCLKEEPYVQNRGTFYTQREDKITQLFEQFQDENEKQSQIVCNNAMDNVVQILHERIADPSIFHYFFSLDEDKFVRRYHEKAIGPAKTEIELTLRRELKSLISRAKAARSQRFEEVAEATADTALTVGKGVAIVCGSAAVVGAVAAGVVLVSQMTMAGTVTLAGIGLVLGARRGQVQDE